MRSGYWSSNDDLSDGSTERRLTLAEVEPSNGFGGWLRGVGRHFRLIVFHAMPEVTTFWEDVPSGLLRVCDTKQNSADWFWLQVECPVRCHRENLQGSTSLHFVGSHNGNGFREAHLQDGWIVELRRLLGGICLG